MLAGIDYLSYTVADATVARGVAASEYAGALAYLHDYAARQRGAVVPRTRYGYVGNVYSGMFVGRRDGVDESSVWVSLAGGVAHQYCVHRLARVSPLARARRIDIQVTVPAVYAESLADVDLAIGGIADSLSRVMPDRSITLIQGYGRGSTLYIGAPSSDVRLVLYNKSAQDSSVGRVMWRLECRFRDERADQAFQGIRSGAAPMAYLSSEASKYSTLFGHFSKVLRDLSDVPMPELTPMPESADARLYRTLRWLEYQVAPAIARLLNYESVTIDSVQALLGLIEHQRHGSTDDNS